MPPDTSPKKSDCAISERVAQRMEYRSKHIQNFIALLHPELEKDISECDVLDVGSGMGVLSLAIAPSVKSVHGIDLDPEFVKFCGGEAERLVLSNTTFEILSALDINEKDSYDIIILSDVLEHIEQQEILLKKCVDALRPGGVMYISTNNKLWPIEGHKFLPFLTYMPRKIANKYVKFMGKGKDYEGYYLPSYRTVRALLDPLPITYAFKSPVNPERILYKIGIRFIQISESLWIFANAFQIIIKKNA